MKRASMRGILIPVLLALAVLLGGCAADDGAESGQTTASSPTTAGTGGSSTVPTASAATTPAASAAVRPLDGPEAENGQFVLRTGDAEVVRDEGSGTVSVFIWCEVENRSEASLTVSSLLSVTLSDTATGNVSSDPDVLKIFGKLVGIDPECATLDGEIVPGGRLSGWIYGEFASDVPGVRIQMILSGTADAAQTEPVTLERTLP